MNKGIAQGLYESSSVKLETIGKIFNTDMNKSFRYALIGAANLVVGNLLQDAAQDTQFEGMSVAADAAIGATVLLVTNGTTAVTANQFVDGTLGVYTTPGLGEQYKIKGHSTGVSGATLTLQLDRPLVTALTAAASKVTMKRSIWSGVIQYPITTQTGVPAGVAQYALTLAQYGWVQTHGDITVLSDNSTFAVGSGLVPSLAAAGAVGVNVAGTTHTPVGVARMAAASAHCISAFLVID